jgi:hypothetical protein
LIAQAAALIYPIVFYNKASPAGRQEIMDSLPCLKVFIMGKNREKIGIESANAVSRKIWRPDNLR